MLSIKRFRAVALAFRAGRLRSLAVGLAAFALIEAGIPTTAESSTSNGARTCGSQTLEGAFTVPSGQGIHQVLRITDNCTVVVDPKDVISLAQVEQLIGVLPVAQGVQSGRLPDSSTFGKGPGLKSPVALVAGGPLHMKLRLLDAINIDVTSINPHDLSYGYNGSTITSYSQSAYRLYATDNTGYCGTGYYGWHPTNEGISVSGGGIGYSFIDSLAHTEFWYQGIFSQCDPYQYYNILDTKLTGFGNGSPSTCAYRLQMAKTAPGWHTDLLCWDAYTSVTPPPF